MKNRNNIIIKKYNGQNISEEVSIQSSKYNKYLYIVSQSDINIDFITNGERSNGDIFFIFFGDGKILANLKVLVKHSNCNINLNLISFMQNASDFDLNGDVFIPQNIDNSEGHLNKKNIILGEKVKIKSVPRLDIYSNNIKASHGLSIDRIDWQKEFYLKSKGLDKASAQRLIVSGNIQSILNQFENISDDQKSEIENQILSKIL